MLLSLVQHGLCWKAEVPYTNISHKPKEDGLKVTKTDVVRSVATGIGKGAAIAAPITLGVVVVRQVSTHWKELKKFLESPTGEVLLIEIMTNKVIEKFTTPDCKRVVHFIPFYVDSSQG